MPSSGESTVDLTAIVLSATNQAVSGRTVTFSTGTDITAFVNNISAIGVSDANGIVTATLNLGGNKANRTITLTATADSATATNSVDVTGTAITISGNSSLASGAATTLTFTLKDSAGTALPGVTVSVASQTGNGIALTPVTAGMTNSSGQITATITATQAGNDVITATAAGASATQALTISSANFAFTTPATNTEIPLAAVPPAPLVPGSTATVTVNWTDAVTPPVGPVSFSTSRGAISGGTVTPNSSALVAGNASVSVSSTTAGPAIITASGPTGTPAATLNVIFVATSASSVTLQAVPGTIQVTNGSASQVTNSSTISALVRDAANNLVKNASVSFTITSDPTGGTLTSSTGTTDVSGIASVTYIAGSISSGQVATAVTISATVDKIGVNAITPITTTTALIIAGQSLLLRLGTDNLITTNTPVPTYSKTYVAIVSDAAGNPVAGATVRFALRPGRFFKGSYSPPVAPSTFWGQGITATCLNEDVNFNGNVDPGEDTNGNGRLDPGGVAVVNATAITDANGIANATITYAKDHANWAEVILEARTGVVGNDPPALVTDPLAGLASDFNSATIPPPGQTSPYGAGDPLAIPAGNGPAGCSNTN
jgi:Big-like domain-containing protein